MQKVGMLFPGQGAQFVGMGRDLYENFPEAKEVFDQANELLGYSISKICFEGPEEELTRTYYAQPAIFVTSMAALAVIKKQVGELKPSFVAGLSLGEFSALVAAEALSFEDGLKLVQKRAEAMEKAAQNTHGTMASIMGLDQVACTEVATETGCEVANLNAPDQIVLSGSVESITKACSLAEEKGAKRAIPLKVGGAFHSSLMLEAKEALEEALKNTQINKPQCIFIPNVEAVDTSDPEQIRKLLAKQLMSSVRWVETMQRATESGITKFLEIGPGKVLKGLARRSNKELEVTTIGTAADFENLTSLSETQ